MRFFEVEENDVRSFASFPAPLIVSLALINDEALVRLPTAIIILFLIAKKPFSMMGCLLSIVSVVQSWMRTSASSKYSPAKKNV